MTTLEQAIFSIQTPAHFEQVALSVFQYQAAENPVYRHYLDLLRVQPEAVQNLQQIPFLPIEFFKSKTILTGQHTPQLQFTSSGTTGNKTSRHYVAKAQLYEQSFLATFRQFYGQPSDYIILALLPGYLERQGSSLIYMVQHLIQQSGHSASGFYLHDHDKLAQQLRQNEQQGQKTLLIGVSFALLDLLDAHQFQLQHTLIMETGGMKGRKKEVTRHELHEQLAQGFGTPEIHSEYGMTELLSQAYSRRTHTFACPPWMQVRIRDVYDPFAYLPSERTGGINVIDLANLHSCAFIETQDLGKLHPNGEFEVLGRFDSSDIRGCNLLVQ